MKFGDFGRNFGQATLPDEAHTLAGAPATVWTVVTMGFAAGDELKLDFEFRQIAKTATRLPEALFVQFRPAVPSDGWVRRHDTAAIWVAFFSRCQQRSCQQDAAGYGWLVALRAR